MKNASLVIIDPQTDFVSKTGSLPVPGATRDMDNTARFLRNHIADISCLVVTADDHSMVHISHPAFWHNKDGNLPSPFTVITLKDVLEEVWVPFSNRTYVLGYLKRVESMGKLHTIWPVHCLANSEGASFWAPVANAIGEWEINNHQSCVIIRKGNFWYAEQHSPFSLADSERDFVNDPEFALINGCETVYFAGEAYSHCLKDTVVDCIKMGMDPKKIVILTNCTSAIPGFDMKDFEKEYKAMGVRFMESGDVA